MVVTGDGGGDNPPPPPTWDPGTDVPGPTPYYPPTDPGDGGGDWAGGYYGGDPSSSTMTLTITLSGPKVDPKQETKCFTPSQGATLTVYVQQAVPNTNNLNGGQHGVGHTFVGIEQNGITRYVGYYPQTGSSQLQIGLGRNYPGELRDNSGEVYDVSITKPVDGNQLAAILGYINNFPDTYSLNRYNCADFGIAVGNLDGMNLPATTTSAMGGFFNGRSPGELGQDIRGLAPAPGTSINPNGGNAPTKQGSCP